MDKAMWERAVSYHGHECPGLAIGVRACEIAIKKMNIKHSKDEELVCVTENDACGVDGVQALLGCSVGKGNLVFRPTGKMAFTFFNRATGEALRLYCKAQRGGMDFLEYQDYLLNAPEEDVFVSSAPKFAMPEKARHFESVVCAKCGEMLPDCKAHLCDGQILCADCYDEYDRGW